MLSIALVGSSLYFCCVCVVINVCSLVFFPLIVCTFAFVSFICFILVRNDVCIHAVCHRAEVIRDPKTKDSLCYAFIEFDDHKSCEEAYFKMDNVVIDDRRIHVDFSQCVLLL